MADPLVPEAAKAPELDPALQQAVDKCRRCKNWFIVSDYVRVKELVESAVAKMQGALQENKFKPSVGDFLRLLEAEKELENAAIKEIRVTWVEEPEKPKSSE